MRPLGLKSRIFRFLASFLAAGGLLGHGLAMLLVALLVQAPATAEADSAGYGEICTAAGDPAEGNDTAPGHPPGRIDACPVCTAFAQSGPVDLPQALQLPARATTGTIQPPVQEALPAAADRRSALSRGPPALA